MKLKLLFIVLVVILLSTAVSAKSPPAKTTHKDTGGSYVSERKAGIQLQTNAAILRMGASMTESVASIHRGIGSLGFSSASAKGEELTKDAAKLRAQAAEAEEKGKARLAAAESHRGTIRHRGRYAVFDFVQAYDDWSGLNKYGVLFYGEEGLAKRRDMAADYFCERVLGILGDKECWKSRICSQAYGQKEMPVGRSVLVAQTGIGGYLPAVSVQAEKSLPIRYKEGGKSKIKYVYKVTYSIANPHVGKTLTYHVNLQGSAHTYTSESMTVKAATEEEIFRESKLGNNPLIIEGDANYHTVCLTFSPRMRTHNWNYQSEICSPITQYGGEATTPYEATPTNATG